MKLKCSLLLVIWSLSVWGSSGSSKVISQQAENGNSKMTVPTPTPQPSQRGFSKKIEDVRASFNRDKGKVRLVTLLSPT